VVRARTDLGLVAVLALVACLVRAPIALPLVLALPGYAIVAALFRPSQLRGVEIVLLSIALSVVATVFAALLLAALGVRLTTAAWLDTLAAVTLVAAVRGTARGHARTLRLPRVRLSAAEVLALGGALVLLSGAGVLGLTPLAAPKGAQGTTALTILPLGEGVVELGVISDELHVTSYRVTLTVAGKRGPRFGPIILAPGARWSRVVSVGLGTPLVAATLSQAARPSATYASVALRCWCTGPGAPPA